MPNNSRRNAEVGVALDKEHIMGKMKFNMGDKIIGNNKKADYWDKKGIVIGYNRATSEYQIRLENGEAHYVSPRWFDKLD